MPSLSIMAEKQFLTYLQKLRKELDTAYTHFEIVKALREFSFTRHSDFIEAQTFFLVTLNSNLYSAIMIICRGFIDEGDNCLQMNGFFKLVKENLNLFSTEAYKKRQKAKGRGEDEIQDLVRKHIEITETIVIEDEVELRNLPIHNLKIWRNKTLAHIDKRRALNNIDILKTNPIGVQEIDNIITTLDNVLNRYSISYDGAEYLIGLPPTKHQIEYIMDALSFYRESRKRKK